MSNLPYSIGTRYSNSQIFDAATAEVVHGWQVFAQYRQSLPGQPPKPTGRRSFVNHEGILCGLDLAESERERARAAEGGNALFALTVALKVLRHIPASMFDNPSEHTEAVDCLVSVLTRANGVQQ